MAVKNPTIKICLIEGCGKKARTRGWCIKHYGRWFRNGDPNFVFKYNHDNESRFWGKVEKTESCWIWTGAKNKNGYGIFCITRKQSPETRNKYAHRFSYELENSFMDDNLVIDHLCSNPSCVNPSHLQAVSISENVARTVDRGRNRCGNKGKTHCKNGHEFTIENTSIVGSRRQRRCRTCARLKMARSRLEKRIFPENGN